jgi:site-specific DNA recombinase
VKSPQPVVRCGIYTRKSTEEGLEQEFNSLMAQREAAEAYILSQREQGWTVIPEHYDDGGFSGGNMDRPALKRLLADVEARRIDCVVVYKVDRLSRSLLDFAAIIGVLDKQNITFVSVTQQFNTNSSLGRLTLNVLLSFAQFERELTRERTRDKVFAARRKGKWTGGHPTLGYDVAAGGGKLQVNEAEAKQVREIFSIFNRTGRLIETLDVVDAKGWRTKSWITRDGGTYGGNRFNRHTLAYLLANPIHVGKVRLKGEIHEGEHPAIVDPKVWRRTAESLGASREPKSAGAGKPQQAILRGLLFCEACQMPMVPTYTKRNETKVRYYTCRSAQNRGWKSCPAKTLPAHEIEKSVLARLPEVGDTDQRDALERLVERIAYDGITRQVSVTLREGVDCA